MEVQLNNRTKSPHLYFIIHESSKSGELVNIDPSQIPIPGDPEHEVDSRVDHVFDFVSLTHLC